MPENNGKRKNGNGIRKNGNNESAHAQSSDCGSDTLYNLLAPFFGLPQKKLGTMDGSKFGTSLGFARLFKVFPPTHFFFKTASLDQFAKPTNRFLNGLFVPND